MILNCARRSPLEPPLWESPELVGYTCKKNLSEDGGGVRIYLLNTTSTIRRGESEYTGEKGSHRESACETSNILSDDWWPMLCESSHHASGRAERRHIERQLSWFRRGPRVIDCKRHVPGEFRG